MDWKKFGLAVMGVGVGAFVLTKLVGGKKAEAATSPTASSPASSPSDMDKIKAQIQSIQQQLDAVRAQREKLKNSGVPPAMYASLDALITSLEGQIAALQVKLGK